MINIKAIYKKLINSPEVYPDIEKSDPATQEFKTKYWNFKNLLTINQRILEIMSDMEQTLSGNKVYGYSFLRKNITELSVALFRVITLLDRIAPSKYGILLNKFEKIHTSLDNMHLEIKPGEYRGASWLCRDIKQLRREDAPAAGAKAANLAEARNITGIVIPDGFVLSTKAFEIFIQKNNLNPQFEQIIQCTNFDKLEEVYEASSRLKGLIETATMPDAVQNAMKMAYKSLEAEHGQGVRLAVRSSATGEDELQTSFAGQYHSVLEVRGDELVSAYKKVLAGKYNARALLYRHNKGFSDRQVLMSAAFLVMQDAVSSGVIYTNNTETGSDDVVISALRGLPKALVDGSADPDRFIYSRSEKGLIDRKINEQKTMLCHSAEKGIISVKLDPESPREPAVTDALALALARIAINLEKYFGSPQDIEWCVDPWGKIVILQTRPLQVHHKPADSAGAEYSYSSFRNSLASQDIQPVLKGGITASGGIAQGPVFLIESQKDAAGFPLGGIMVARDALPRWSSLLGKASGLITDHGAAAGHLATVAREFNVPALFNTEKATTVLATNSHVTLDAWACEVFESSLSYTLPAASADIGKMYNTPVYLALKKLLSLVSPLNLTDPGHKKFSPENCETYHDILRFCHEKAVDEMFCLGQEYEGIEASGKRLIAGVPTQWWLINIGGGFKKRKIKDRIRLSEISSQPFLAVWEGMVSHAWQGPPGADAKGLFSIMMESTMNRDLDLVGPSSFALKNYALVSGNFCSLNCRFGYHYSVLQTLCKEQDRENYIRFGFKGGAADMGRKQLRLRLMSQIMEEIGFQINTTEDSLRASFEGGSRVETLKRLKTLGYLIVHTRQMDMVMNNKDQFDYYQHKMQTDISNLMN
ncbi:MAG: PEP/pyruvate-binding domain-containing protein [Desulfonatronovibrio sp.]